MTPFRLLVRNLLYHWRANFAVFLGVVVGAAVLTGALLIGDSLRGSLRDLTLRRLDWVDEARSAAASSASKRPGTCRPNRSARPSWCAARRPWAKTHRPRVQVNVIGVTEGFWSPDGGSGETSFWDSDKSEVVLSKALADATGARAGDRVTFRVGKTGAIPPETLLGKRDEGAVVSEIQATVHAILDADDFGSRFNLAPTTEPPRNAFLPLKTLQKALGQEGRINAVLVGEPKPGLQEDFQKHLTLDDWGLFVEDPESLTDALFARLDKNHDGKLTDGEWYRMVGGKRQPFFAASVADAIPHADRDVLTRRSAELLPRHDPILIMESRQLLIEPAAERAGLDAAKDAGLRAAPMLVYLANTLSDGKAAEPYVVVAALDSTGQHLLWPFLPPKSSIFLQDDRILLAAWSDSPVKAKAGDPITLTYYPPEQHGEFKLATAKFKLAGTVPMSGLAADPGLTPDFPGVTDKTSIRDWNPPFPFDDNRIKPGDASERFWEEHRATPRAYVNLEEGQKLWGSRFGKITSLLLAPEDGGDLQKSKIAFEAALLSHLNPDQAGLVFRPVKEQALKASNGSTDFAVLFVCFSFFLIVAALLLVGLLFRLNLDRRASEFGLLTAVGYRPWTITWLMLGEGALLAVVGSVVGCLAAVAYAALLVQFLGAVWPGGALQSFLRPHYTVLSFVYGGAASLAVSVLTILWAVFSLGRVAQRPAGRSDHGRGRRPQTAEVESVDRDHRLDRRRRPERGRLVRAGRRKPGDGVLRGRRPPADGVPERHGGVDDGCPSRPGRGRRLVGRGPAGRAQRRPPSGAQPADGRDAGVGRVPDRVGRGVPSGGARRPRPPRAGRRFRPRRRFRFARRPGPQ